MTIQDLIDILKNFDPSNRICGYSFLNVITKEATEDSEEEFISIIDYRPSSK